MTDTGYKAGPTATPLHPETIALKVGFGPGRLCVVAKDRPVAKAASGGAR